MNLVYFGGLKKLIIINLQGKLNGVKIEIQ